MIICQTLVVSECIIQKQVVKSQLHEIWPSMSSHRHMLYIKAISLKIKEMASINFPAYGSLYFSDVPVEQSREMFLDYGRFCIGPSCSPVFWNCSPGESEL